MNGNVVVVCLVIVGLCGAALIFFIQKLKGMKGEVDAARAEFRQRVGYDYVSALTWKSSPTREKDTPQGRFTHHFEIYSQGTTRVTAQGWQLETSRPPVVAFQLVDRSLVGATRAVLNLVGPTKRTIAIAYPGPHVTGDADLDARFALYAADVPGASAILRQPELRQALLGLASVSLLVDSSGAMFGDPSDTNVYAQGASRLDVNPAPAIRSAIRVHLAVERILKLAIGTAPAEVK